MHKLPNFQTSLQSSTNGNICQGTTSESSTNRDDNTVNRTSITLLHDSRKASPNSTLEYNLLKSLDQTSPLQDESFDNAIPLNLEESSDDNAPDVEKNTNTVKITKMTYEEEMRRLDTKVALFSAAAGWTDLEKEEIRNVLTAQTRSLHCKLDELEKWDQKSRENFVGAYGTSDEDARAAVKNLVESVLNLAKSLADENFVPAENHVVEGSTARKMIHAVAYVYPDDKTHKIYLMPLFWEKDSGEKADERLATLSHEMSHFTDVGATVDDSPFAGKILVPEKALKSAYVFENYVHNLPPVTPEHFAKLASLE